MLSIAINITSQKWINQQNKNDNINNSVKPNHVSYSNYVSNDVDFST